MSRVLEGAGGRLENTTDNFGITTYPFSVAFWVKFTTITTGHSIWEYRNDTGTTYSFYGYIVNTDRYRMIANQSALAQGDIATDLTTGTWHAFVVTHTTNDINAYISGDSIQSTTSQSYQTNSSPGVRIGNRYGGTSINGKIAHFTVWDVVLSEANRNAFLNGDDPDNIDQSNQTRYWALTTTSLTDARNSVVLTATSATFDGTDNPDIGNAAYKTAYRLNVS